MPAKLIPFERSQIASGAPSSSTPGIEPRDPLPQSRDAQGIAPLFACPRCGRENPPNAYFCVDCHQILIHRCPNCWHEQRTGPICENCGTNMPVYWQAALDKSMEDETRLGWARMWAAATWLAQIVMLPFGSAFGVARGMALRLLTARFRAR
ncbi:MAG TPA: zinc ribbon domain-containing protein [Candidatus Acidoferrales bacterium]